MNVVLFRRDLRVDDHEALETIATQHSGTPLVPLYVYDPDLLSHECCSTAHHIFISDCLEELHLALEERGSGLVVRVGHLRGILMGLLAKYGTFCLWSHRVTGTAHEQVLQRGEADGSASGQDRRDARFVRPRSRSNQHCCLSSQGMGDSA